MRSTVGGAFSQCLEYAHVFVFCASRACGAPSRPVLAAMAAVPQSILHLVGRYSGAGFDHIPLRRDALKLVNFGANAKDGSVGWRVRSMELRAALAGLIEVALRVVCLRIVDDMRKRSSATPRPAGADNWCCCWPCLVLLTQTWHGLFKPLAGAATFLACYTLRGSLQSASLRSMSAMLAWARPPPVVTTRAHLLTAGAPHPAQASYSTVSAI